jgi:hypothetical protein
MSLNKFVDTTLKPWMNIGADEIKCNLLEAQNLETFNFITETVECDELKVGALEYTNGVTDTKTMLFIPVDEPRAVRQQINPYVFYSNDSQLYTLDNIPQVIVDNNIPSAVQSSLLLKLANDNAYSFFCDITYSGLAPINDNTYFYCYLDNVAMNQTDFRIPSTEADSDIKFKVNFSCQNVGSLGVVVSTYECLYKPVGGTAYVSLMQIYRNTFDLTDRTKSFSLKMTSNGVQSIQRQQTGMNCLYSDVTFP